MSPSPCASVPPLSLLTPLAVAVTAPTFDGWQEGQKSAPDTRAGV